MGPAHASPHPDKPLERVLTASAAVTVTDDPRLRLEDDNRLGQEASIWDGTSDVPGYIATESSDVVQALKSARNGGTEVSIYCQGDSTMLQQVTRLVQVLRFASDPGTFEYRATWAGSLERLDLAKRNAALFVPESAAAPRGGQLCSMPSVGRARGTVQGLNVTLVAAICTTSLLTVTAAPTIIQALREPPYAFSELATAPNSLIYIGGAGLHYLHDESTRWFDELKSMLAFGAFEDRLQTGLKALVEMLPREAKVAYYSTNEICDEKILQDDIRARAYACAAGDASGCFECACPAAVERCHEFCQVPDTGSRMLFNTTMMSNFGSHTLANREWSILHGDAALRGRVLMVDARELTEGKCDFTEDGRHYVGVDKPALFRALGAFADPSEPSS